MTLIAFLLARLKEPSTYAGLGAILAAAGLHPSAALLSSAVNAAIALAGLAAVLLPESGQTKVILPAMPPGQAPPPPSPARSPRRRAPADGERRSYSPSSRASTRPRPSPRSLGYLILEPRSGISKDHELELP